MRRRPWLLVVLFAAGVGACGAGADDPKTATSAASAGKFRNCRPPYSPQSPWNTPIRRGSVTASDSSQLLATINGPLTSDPTQYTYPLYGATARKPQLSVYVADIASIVTSPHRLRRIPARELRVPLAANAQPASGSDGQLILLDPRTGDEWGFWQFFNVRDPLLTDAPAGSGSGRLSLALRNAYAHYYPGSPVVLDPGGPGTEKARIRSIPDGGHVVLTAPTKRAHRAGTRVWAVAAANGYRYNIQWSGVLPAGVARGAGVTYLAGLVRPCEIAQGHIDHAVAFAYPNTTTQFVYPARKTDGKTAPGQGLPEGARLQLDPSIGDRVIRQRWGCRGACFTIAKALQRYGMYLVDTAGRPKLVVEDDQTAHWHGKVTASTVSHIPVTALRLLH